MQFIRRLTSCNTGYFKTSKTLSFPFCSRAANKSETVAVPEDWQYCRMISSELKGNNVNQALGFLFQSYFNGKILDIQIYNSVFEKINELSLPLSYAEILYEIYREHFPPNALIRNWMSKLTESGNEKLVEKLKLDYKAIGQSYPVRFLKNNRKQGKKQQKVHKDGHSETKEDNSGAGKSSSRGVSRPPNFDQVAGTSVSDYEEINKLTQESNQDFLRIKSVNDIKEMFESLNIGIGNYSKVVLQDIEITINNPHEATQNMQEEQDEDEDEQYDEQEEESEEQPFFGLDINKIKIGKIEFFNQPKDKQDQ